MKIGDVVVSKKLKGRATIRAINGNEVLVECKNTDDGFLYFCVSEGITCKDNRRRLRWIKRDLVEVVECN